MASVNQTYNFNYPNMNFGQSMLYGLFGSLTGGMGMMGMGGSIFSPMGMGCYGGFGGFGMGGYGMGGYGMGCFSDQVVGMQIGASVFNIGIMALGQYLDGRGGKKAERTENINNLEEEIKTLSEEISELDSNNTYDKISKTIDAEYDKNIKSAEKSVDSLNTSRSQITANIEALKGQYDLMPANTPEEKEAKEKFKREKIDPQKEQLDILDGDKNTKGSIKEAEEKVELAKKAKEDAIKEIMKENSKKIEDKKKELEELKQDLYKLQQEVDSKVFDKADGKSTSRMTDDEFNNKFYDAKGELKSELTDVDIKAIRTAANHLVTAKSSSERKKYAKQFVKLYDAWTGDEANKQKKGSLEKTYNLALKYQNE